MALYLVKGYDTDIQVEVNYTMQYCNGSTMIIKLNFADYRSVSQSIVTKHQYSLNLYRHLIKYMFTM
jgi:hypothetical protein